MSNNRNRSFVLDKNTFVDEFETGTPFSNVNIDTSKEKLNIQQTIEDNYNKIFSGNRQNAFNNVEVREPTVENEDINVSPSERTMQFRNKTKAEVYQDYREDTQVNINSKYKTSGKIKALVIVCIVLGAIFLALTVFNSILLNKMDSIIDSKIETISELKSQNDLINQQIQEAQSEEVIEQKLRENGYID